MSRSIEIGGKNYTQLGERVIFQDGVWKLQQFIEGDHTGHERFGATFGSIGYKHEGETGTETVRESLLPSSLVDSSITVNGKSNASMAYLVGPEYRHLLPTGQSFTPPWEIGLTGEGAVRETMQIIAEGLSISVKPINVEVPIASAAA